jgi:hypothetical protein
MRCISLSPTDLLLNYVGHESFSLLSLDLVYWEEVSALLVEKSLLKDPSGGPMKHEDFPQNSLIRTYLYIRAIQSFEA